MTDWIPRKAHVLPKPSTPRPKPVSAPYRIREAYCCGRDDSAHSVWRETRPDIVQTLVKALAAERRATVERIRVRLAARNQWVAEMLDEEADR